MWTVCIACQKETECTRIQSGSYLCDDCFSDYEDERTHIERDRENSDETMSILRI